MMKEDLLSMRNNIDFSNNRMKLLVIGNKERFIHLENFLSKLDNKDFETKLIHDLDYKIKTMENGCTPNVCEGWYRTDVQKGLTLLPIQYIYIIYPRHIYSILFIYNHAILNKKVLMEF